MKMSGWVSLKFCIYVRVFVMLLLQYPVFFAVCVLTAVFSYVRPYRSRFANHLDSLFWVNTIVLFLLALPDSFQTLEPYNVTDTASGCTGEKASVYIFTTVVYAMFVSYYFPLIVVVVTTIGFTVRAILRYIYIYK